MGRRRGPTASKLPPPPTRLVSNFASSSSGFKLRHTLQQRHCHLSQPRLAEVAVLVRQQQQQQQHQQQQQTDDVPSNIHKFMYEPSVSSTSSGFIKTLVFFLMFVSNIMSVSSFDFQNDVSKVLTAEPPFTGIAGLYSFPSLPQPYRDFTKGKASTQAVTQVSTDQLHAAAAAAATLLTIAPSAATPSPPVKLFVLARMIGGRRHRAVRGGLFASRRVLVALIVGDAPPQRWPGCTMSLPCSCSVACPTSLRLPAFYTAFSTMARSPEEVRLGRGHSFPLMSQWGETRRKQNKKEQTKIAAFVRIASRIPRTQLKDAGKSSSANKTFPKIKKSTLRKRRSYCQKP